MIHFGFISHLLFIVNLGYDLLIILSNFKALQSIQFYQNLNDHFIISIYSLFSLLILIALIKYWFFLILAIPSTLMKIDQYLFFSDYN
jgi:hypothetical protein